MTTDNNISSKEAAEEAGQNHCPKAAYRFNVAAVACVCAIGIGANYFNRPITIGPADRIGDRLEQLCIDRFGQPKRTLFQTYVRDYLSKPVRPCLAQHAESLRESVTKLVMTLSK